MNRFKVNNRVLMGILIITVGVVLLLGTFDVLDASSLFSKGWPVILMVIGIISIVNTGSSKIFGIFIFLLGVFYQLKVLDIIFGDISLWQFVWPMAIIVMGLWLIFPKRPKTIDADTLSSTAIFSGADVNIISQNFAGGEANAIFGGLDIDMTSADLDTTQPVIIDLFVAFGGVDLKVPDDWAVQIKGLPLFGGWDNKHKPTKMGFNDPQQAPKLLIIKAFVMFGGFDVK